MTDIKAVVLRAQRRVAIVVALLIMALAAFLVVRAVFAWIESASQGVPFTDAILGSWLEIVPEGLRPVATVALWLFVIAGVVPMLARNSLLVGIIAARVESDHMLLWVPLSVRSRPSRGLRVERGQTVVLTHLASKEGLFKQNDRRSVTLTAPAGTLFTSLDTTPEHYSIAGLLDSARAAGVTVDIQDSAKDFDDSPR